MLVILAFLPMTLFAQENYKILAQRKQQEAKEIAWPIHEPLWFYLRRGHHSVDWIENYHKQHSPENIKNMAVLGVRMRRLPFYKGFGLEFEKEGIEDTKRTASLMHKYGMKVSAYIGGTMFSETLFREQPNAVNWQCRDQDGKPIYYLGIQTYRRFPCILNQEYLAYLKKVVKKAIVDVGTDEIFFDNFFLRSAPKDCRSPIVLKAFKEYLKKKYPTKEQVFRRFGYRTVEYLELPHWDVFNSPFDLKTIDDPVLQEWVNFRCRMMADYSKTLYDYAKSINPNIAVGFNIKGLIGRDRAWLDGIYQPLFIGHCDFFTPDAGIAAGIVDHRSTIAEIRSYKMGRTLGISVNHGGNDLEMAVWMAFNKQCRVKGFGYEGTPWGYFAGRSFSELAEFFRKYNSNYFQGMNAIADVAVLRSYPSMAYSIYNSRYSTILVEQTLMQTKIPFDIIFDEQLPGLSRYKTLVLANQEALSDKNVEIIKQFVKQGGGLVLTENTGALNHWRERRTRNAFADLIGIKGNHLPGRKTVGTFGKGMVCYFPKLEADGPMQEASGLGTPAISAKSWKMPDNWQELADAIRDVTPDGFSVVVDAPLTTLAEAWHKDAEKQTIIHLINFDSNNCAQNIKVKLQNQFKGTIKKVTMLSPEIDGQVDLPFEKQDESILFTVPEVQLYRMIVVQ